MDMHIGELARAAGVNIQTIRFYERQALLPKPPRNSSGYRSYEHKDVERVTFIKRNQELGFTLTEIKQLIQLHEAKARLEKSMRARDLVAVDLGYVAIRAPITGTIASVSTQEGETVAASFASPTFVTIIADHALQLVGMVDETDIAHVRPGNPVTFTVDAYPARDFPGRVESIAPKATIVSGVVNYEVTIRITESAELLKPDMTANLSIQTAETDALLLPATALERDADGAFVYVAGKNATERRRIVTGSKENSMVEIKIPAWLDWSQRPRGFRSWHPGYYVDRYQGAHSRPGHVPRLGRNRRRCLFSSLV